MKNEEKTTALAWIVLSIVAVMFMIYFATTYNKGGVTQNNEESISASSTDLGKIQSQTVKDEGSNDLKVTPAVVKSSQKNSANSDNTKILSKQEIKSTGILCNGSYWNECPVGQNFVCPATGSAYCQTPQQSVQSVPQKDNYQICKDSYNGHATWNGTSYTSSGGPNCSCDSGYAPSSDGKSCEVLGTPYKGQNGNCYYPNAYDSDGNALRATCPVQLQPAVVSAGDSVACLDAKKKLSDFEKQAPYTLSNSAGSNVASDVAQRRTELLRQTLLSEETSLQQTVNTECQ